MKNNDNSLKKDTIAAIATPIGRGGVGIIRVSGSGVSHVMELVLKKKIKPRHASYGAFWGADEEELDKGISIFFPKPDSFTGEDVLELHGHGGPILLNMLLNRVLDIGAREAYSGEFTERSFLNGKMDLIQVEGIADLIDSATEQHARAAMRSLQGVFSRKINQLIDELVKLRMYVEAAIDFSEEEIDFFNNTDINNRLTVLLEKFNDVEKTASAGVVLRDGIKIAILGPPNAGKSSLLNLFAKKDAAIVSDIKGTTRDILKEIIHIDGLSVHFSDTAGICETNNPIEKMGVEKAYTEMMLSDIIFYVVDGSCESPKEAKNNFLKMIGDRKIKAKVFIVRNKIDITNEQEGVIIDEDVVFVNISVKKEQGVVELKECIKERVNFTGITSGSFSARRRHINALLRAKNYMQEGKCRLEEGFGDLLAEDLKAAQNSLEEIVGVLSSDELLGKIFSEFCIGK